MPNNDYLALQRLDISPDEGKEIKYYKRIMINNEIIVSKDYTRMKKRYNFTVLLTNNHVFEIKGFIVIEVVSQYLIPEQETGTFNFHKKT